MKVGILPCQGACNTGNMTNKVALEFVDNEKINMVCSLGIPLGITNIIEKAKANDKFVALNGCNVNCASQVLQNIDINDFEEFVFTEDFEMEKNKNFGDETNIKTAMEEVKKVIEKYDY